MMFNALIEVKKTHKDAIIPGRATLLSSGFDLHALDVVKPEDYKKPINDNFESYTVQPGERVFIHTGVAFKLNHVFYQLPYWSGFAVGGIEAQVRPRSGLALKQGIHVHLGTIDADYRGEIGVILFNLGNEPFTIKKGDRIAQIVFLPILNVTLAEVNEFDHSTTRGDNGFGSSGVSA